MEECYWYKWCPRCSQGRLIIMEDRQNDRLYLNCEECEWGFLNPEKADIIDEGLLTLDDDFGGDLPDFDTIKRHGWDKYALKSCKDS